MCTPHLITYIKRQTQSVVLTKLSIMDADAVSHGRIIRNRTLLGGIKCKELMFTLLEL